MNHYFRNFCYALIGIAAGMVLLFSCAHAARSVAVQIDGVDTQCGSFAASVSNGTTVYTCVPVSNQPGAPSGCSATVNSSSSLTLTSSGGTANFAASCSSPTSGITWNWSKNSVFGANTNASWTDTLSSNPSTTTDVFYRYQARACNGVSCTTFPSTPLLVTVRAIGGGGGSFNGECGGFDSTVVLNMDWDTPVRMYTSQHGGMGPNSAVVVVFTTGNGNSPSNNLPKIGGAEYNSTPTARYAVLSATPCDFGAQSTPGASASGYSVTVPFALGSGSNFGYYPQLLNNHTYYLNIRNLQNPACASAGSQSCDMFVDLLKGGL